MTLTRNLGNPAVSLKGLIPFSCSASVSLKYRTYGAKEKGFGLELQTWSNKKKEQETNQELNKKMKTYLLE